ncbi:hypothetical protein DPMN_114291 [Dreissena polymorpha]|uniref:Uncharacterized protein n=1 Tax=Dreissena polymorpha TaxID=45954 RepID=A0A9D4KJR1_DREPO|nr:hypothetical protein DPMN_114291 [Dreissena polymorpha]
MDVACSSCQRVGTEDDMQKEDKQFQRNVYPTKRNDKHKEKEVIQFDFDMRKDCRSENDFGRIHGTIYQNVKNIECHWSR